MVSVCVCVCKVNWSSGHGDYNFRSNPCFVDRKVFVCIDICVFDYQSVPVFTCGYARTFIVQIIVC